VVVIVGAKLSSQGPDKDHPFGHGRWEYITSFLIAIFLGFIAVEFTKEAIQNFIAHNAAEFGTTSYSSDDYFYSRKGILSAICLLYRS
jgi:divalent metal cation (Fe/Co/Zn/Cd) transporter